MSESTAARATQLEAVVAETVRGRRTSAEAAFRARVEERLRSVEAELTDLKARLNGLYLVIASTVLAQVLLKVAP